MQIYFAIAGAESVCNGGFRSVREGLCNAKGLPYFGRRFFRSVRNDKTEFYIFGAVCRRTGRQPVRFGTRVVPVAAEWSIFLPSALFEPKKYRNFDNL